MSFALIMSVSGKFEELGTETSKMKSELQDAYVKLKEQERKLSIASCSTTDTHKPDTESQVSHH